VRIVEKILTLKYLTVKIVVIFFAIHVVTSVKNVEAIYVIIAIMTIKKTVNK